MSATTTACGAARCRAAPRGKDLCVATAATRVVADRRATHASATASAARAARSAGSARAARFAVPSATTGPAARGAMRTRAAGTADDDDAGGKTSGDYVTYSFGDDGDDSAPAGSASSSSSSSSSFKTSLGEDPAFAPPSAADFDAPTIDWANAKRGDGAAVEDGFLDVDSIAGGFDMKGLDDIAARFEAEEKAALAEEAARDAGLMTGATTTANVASGGFEPAAATTTTTTTTTKKQSQSLATMAPPAEKQSEAVRSFLYPGEDQLPDDVSMSIWEHLEELRDRALISSAAVTVMILLCFCFAKDLVLFLEAPVAEEGVRFLQLGPGEYFFTTVKVAGYCGLLLGAPVVLYEAIAYILPGLTKDERKFLGPIVLGSSVLFYAGIGFAYAILTPAALKFFIGYSDQAVESLWSIDQYFEFVLVLLFSTGLSFQVPVIQLLLGQTGIVSSAQMLSVWRYVVVGSVVAAAVLTPSTDPFTQMLLAVPLMSLYLGGAALVGVVEKGQAGEELPEGR